MKKNSSNGILIESESLKKAGTARGADHVASPAQRVHTTEGKEALENKGKLLKEDKTGRRGRTAGNK